MTYKSRFYYTLNADNTIHSSNSTQKAKYSNRICLHCYVTYRDTQQAHSHYNVLMIDDVNRATADVIEQFIELCRERCDSMGFDLDEYEILT